MYLYLGQERWSNTKEVIGIFDLENTSVSRFTKSISRRPANGRVWEVATDIPKSFVVCQRDGKDIGLPVPILHRRSKKRCYYIKDLSNL